MALVSELNQVMADALTFPLPTVSIFSRRLREAGLISKKGRGRGAAHATALDGARLLIPLLANSSAAQAPECVRDFGGLIQDYRMEVGRAVAGPNGADQTEMSGFTIDKAYSLSRHHTFEEALAAIIAGFADDRFVTAFLSAAKKYEVGNNNFTLLSWMEISVHDTALGAAIRLGGNEYHYTYKSMVNVPDGKLIECADEFSAVASKYTRGIKSRREIGTEVLRKIALVINGREVSFPS